MKNEGYPVSLKVRKLYARMPDADAEQHKQIRIVDEWGDDYLYPEEYFVTIELPDEVERTISEST